jgi:hypothetical protein
MEITPDTPRNGITILGTICQVPAPFFEGHVLTEPESSVLNQTYAENIRNNIASKIRKAQEKGEDFNEVQRQALVDDYVAEYEFGAGARREVDPVKAQALLISESAVKQALIKGGRKLKDYDRADIRKRAEALIEKNPAILKEAERRVKAEQKAIAELGIEI